MKIVSAIVMTALLVSLSIPAYAGDTKFYPATMCQGSVYHGYTSQVFIGSSLVQLPGVYVQPASYATTGAALNPVGEQEMTLVCPIVRDVVRSDNLGWSSLIVNVLNTSHTRNLTCSAQTFYPNDYGFGSASSNTLGTLTDWTDLSLSVLSLPADGYILISCTLPRVDPNGYPSGIASYRIDE
jgi:hypothetical protein